MIDIGVTELSEHENRSHLLMTLPLDDSGSLKLVINFVGFRVECYKMAEQIEFFFETGRLSSCGSIRRGIGPRNKGISPHNVINVTLNLRLPFTSYDSCGQQGD